LLVAKAIQNIKVLTINEDKNSFKFEYFSDTSQQNMVIKKEYSACIWLCYH